MNTEKIVYFFHEWYRGKRYDLCLVNSATQPCFNIKKNKLIAIPYHYIKPTIDKQFSTEGWEKVFDVNYLEEEKILFVKFKKTHYHLKVSITLKEPRVTIEGFPKCYGC